MDSIQYPLGVRDGTSMNRKVDDQEIGITMAPIAAAPIAC
jgi:hypothetical protein